MTELDHTSFDTLMADLSHPAALFCFQHDNGRSSSPWVFMKMNKMIPPSPSGSFYIEIEYGSMDSGKWATCRSALHIFKLCDGYLQGKIGDKIKVVLANGASVLLSTDDQLNNNLQGVFG